MALAAALCGGAWQSSAAEVVRHSVRFDASTVRLLDQGGATAIHMGKASRTWDAGRPELPYVTVSLLVPRAERVVGLRAQAVGEQLVGDGLRLANAVPLVAEDGTLRLPAPERTRAAVAATMPQVHGGSYPALRAELAGDGALHGYRFVNVRVHPIRWEADTGRAWMAGRIDLELELAPSDVRSIERERWRPELEAAARATLEKLVANPEAIDGYDRRIGSPGGEGRRRIPTHRRAESRGQRRRLRHHHERRRSPRPGKCWPIGRRAAACRRSCAPSSGSRPTTATAATCRRPSAPSSKMPTRSGACSTSLLGGDTDILPARYGYSPFGEPPNARFPPTCISPASTATGTRTATAGSARPRSIWGRLVTRTDFYAEVFVGRMPFSSAAEVATYVTKIDRLREPGADVLSGRRVAAGRSPFPGELDRRRSGYPSTVLPSARNWPGWSRDASRPHSSTRTTTTYPGSSLLTRSATLAEMNAGPGLVNHIGHGYPLQHVVRRSAACRTTTRWRSPTPTSASCCTC